VIKSLAHAKAVQARRFAERKRGYAKAVRRFFGKVSGNYREKLNALPSRWPARE